MKKDLEINSESAYYRKCLYCEEKFIANHALRRFCLDKFGIPNYCKHRYKVLVQEARLGGEEVNQSYTKKGIEPEAISSMAGKAFDGPVTLEAVDEYNLANPEVSGQTTRENNMNILKALLVDGKSKEIMIADLNSLGLDFGQYDRQRKLSGSGLYFIEIGDYAIFWTEKNKLLITPITEILWMSQT